jgi:hypothetical protein
MGGPRNTFFFNVGSRIFQTHQFLCLGPLGVICEKCSILIAGCPRTLRARTDVCSVSPDLVRVHRYASRHLIRIILCCRLALPLFQHPGRESSHVLSAVVVAQGMSGSGMYELVFLLCASHVWSILKLSANRFVSVPTVWSVRLSS